MRTSTWEELRMEWWLLERFGWRRSAGWMKMFRSRTRKAYGSRHEPAPCRCWRRGIVGRSPCASACRSAAGRLQRCVASGPASSCWSPLEPEHPDSPGGKNTLWCNKAVQVSLHKETVWLMSQPTWSWRLIGAHGRLLTRHTALNSCC